MKLDKSAVHILFAGTLMGLSGCGTEFGQQAISNPSRVSQIPKGVTTGADVRAAPGGATEGSSKGSILPPEQTWSLDTADEFDGPVIDSRLWPSGSGGDVPQRSGVCYYNSRSITFSNVIIILD